MVNEVGARLGAAVLPGRYRGTVKHSGWDGLWKFPTGRSIVIEVKTTDAYNINLGTVVGYRKALVEEGSVKEDESSILLVVGRQETDTLEAQIRGSQHAWDIRVISVDALLRLMAIKEELEDPNQVQRIHAMLVPREFTRLDAIAELLFFTAEDIKQDDAASHPDEPTGVDDAAQTKIAPAAFHETCVARVQTALHTSLIKRTRSGYSSPDNQISVICSISKEHDAETTPNYWFAFHPHQREFLSQCSRAYVALGCGSADRILLIPFDVFQGWLEDSWTTAKEDSVYWHVVIYRQEDEYTLRLRKGAKRVDLTSFALGDAI